MPKRLKLPIAFAVATCKHINTHTAFNNGLLITFIYGGITGFAGELCNFEYNECESNPCQNDGECIDHIGNFECRCSKGYTGARCQIKVSSACA